LQSFRPSDFLGASTPSSWPQWTAAIRRAEDIAPAFAALKGRAAALYVSGADLLVVANRISINALATDARLPTMHTAREVALADEVIE
jgi:hypothetical protein